MLFYWLIAYHKQTKHNSSQLISHINSNICNNKNTGKPMKPISICKTSQNGIYWSFSDWQMSPLICNFAPQHKKSSVITTFPATSVMYLKKSTPRAVPQEKVFVINFHLAGKIWGTPQLKKKINMTHKFWITTLFNWKIMFIHQLNDKISPYITFMFICLMCSFNCCKRCFFSSPN